MLTVKGELGNKVGNKMMKQEMVDRYGRQIDVDHRNLMEQGDLALHDSSDSKVGSLMWRSFHKHHCADENFLIGSQVSLDVEDTSWRSQVFEEVRLG